MRVRVSTLIAGVVVAAGLGVVSAPAASACAEEQCPLVCRLMEQVLSRPVCRIQAGTEIGAGG